MQSPSEPIQEDLYVHKRIIVDAGQQAERIDRYLLSRLEHISRNRIQHALRSGAILVNNKTVKASHKVCPGEVIVIVLPEPPKESFEIEPEDIPLNIVYEDPYLLVVNKKPGMVGHPGIGNRSGTLVNAIAYHLGSSTTPTLPGNKSDRPGLVHRLDKDTSGLLVIAKEEFTLTALAKQFFDRDIEREYLALVWGEPKEEAGSIDFPIGRNPRFRHLMHAFKDGSEGKHAVTNYELVKGMYYVSLVKCKLETGRTHQIRVHMASIGHPVFSDSKYGGGRILKGTVYTKYRQFVENCFSLMPRQALHAATLGFKHPVSGEYIRIESELPSDFKAVLKKWENYLDSRNPKS